MLQRIPDPVRSLVMELPSEREVRRAASAVALGIVLGLVLLIAGRRAHG
jgi:hypothetical protein